MHHNYETKMNAAEFVKILTDAILDDEALKQLRYSVEMKRYNNIQDLLTKIEKTQKVKFLIQGKSIYIRKWMEAYDLLE